MTVEYREIIGFPGYRVGDDGTVWSCKSHGKGGWILTNDWYQLKLLPNHHGHLHVDLSNNGKIKRRSVHTLILITFVGPCSIGYEGCHKDDNPSNNQLSNLYWGTKLENAADRDRNGRTSRGENRPAAKLNEAKVREIFKLRKTGLKHREIGACVGVSHAAVGYVLRRQTWTHIECVL